MEIRGRYYFIFLIAIIVVSKLIDLYIDCECKEWVNNVLGAILVMLTVFNLVGTIGEGRLGKDWYASMFVCNRKPFLLFNFSWTMLICFLFVKIMNWCDKFLTHNINWNGKRKDNC